MHAGRKGGLSRREALAAGTSALIGATCNNWETPTAPTVDQLVAQVTLQITEPANNSILLSPDIVVSGTYAPADFTDPVWVLVWPELAGNKGYPQSGNAGIGEPAIVDRSSQRWSVGTGLGGPPQFYDISVHFADPAASRRLSDILIEWTRANFFPGLAPNELPFGLHERHRIRIRRIDV